MNYLEEEHSINKESWGDGEWQHEPDRCYWIDEKTGLDCLIVRASSHGGLCGYVGVTNEHPYFMANYNDVPANVHGGLTYGDTCQEGGSICHVPRPGRDANVYWLGFDCAHSGDLSPAYAQRWAHDEFSTYKTLEYVTVEVTDLARQLDGLMVSQGGTRE